MDTESRTREPVAESNGVGWKWSPDEGAYLWWDGERYTARANWDGTSWSYGARRTTSAGFRWGALSILASTLGVVARVWVFELGGSNDLLLSLEILGASIGLGLVFVAGLRREESWSLAMAAWLLASVVGGMFVFLERLGEFEWG